LRGTGKSGAPFGCATFPSPTCLALVFVKIVDLTMIKRLGNIEISESEISEYDRNLKAVIIPKEKKATISIEHGFSEERPILSILIGLLTLTLGIGFGLLPISRMLLRSINGAYVNGNMGIFAFSVPLLFIGGWFIVKTMRYSYFIKVATVQRTRKMPFGTSVQKTEIQSFIEDCNSTLGYNILINI
jgi:hypothetical protein